ncbi:MAG: hypothetical protein L0332_25095 [Chloroflexi bacterium]|nr:hypothetical protein [Chloroflexota bacterium]MCI0575167.1 hypothetical protein [Chloroflexota bacterium]MCI0647151.1 hypothetical protein [Chloroflexota bacterium]MCI0729973.1 hypothetical protein [Chloroflexota bacterium]
MKKYIKLMVGLLVLACLLGLNISVANAHQWSSYHWDKSGTAIHIYNYFYGSHQTQARAARYDGWTKIGILYNYEQSSHTHVSVFGQNSGDTGWGGLASITSVSWTTHCWWWCHINHVHSQYNSYYPRSSLYIQGIFCQEIGHAWGLAHSDTGDCMGLGYYNFDKYYYGSHNNTDFYNMYCCGH